MTRTTAQPPLPGLVVPSLPPRLPDPAGTTYQAYVERVVALAASHWRQWYERATKEEGATNDHD